MSNERLDLALKRIGEIPFEEGQGVYAPYFEQLAARIHLMFEIYEIYAEKETEEMDLESLFALQEEMYAGLLPKDYESSLCNPAFLEKEYRKEGAAAMAALALELQSVFKLLLDGRQERLLAVLELFLQVYGICREEDFSSAAVEEAIYFYAFDYLDVTVKERVRDTYSPSYTLFKDIILEQDLEDLRYLFRFGEYVSRGQVETAKYLNALSEAEIEKMAFTYTNGFVQGFIAGRKDLSQKKYVQIIYELGFERIVKKAMEQFAAMGLEPVLARLPYMMTDKAPNRNYGCGTPSYNKQLDYDHRFDSAVFYQKAYTDRRLDQLKLAYEEMNEILAQYAGPAVMETFGEAVFSPENNPYAPAYDEKQKKLQQNFSVAAMALRNRYVPSEETSFTIIAWPVSDIAKCAKDYAAIFDDIIRVNTLDYRRYRDLQQKIIDALDKAEYVMVEGAGANRTKMKIRLHHLENPEKESNFENCVADVNIPVGEVFTSPLLTGTEGILHVQEVFLWDISFRDLEIEFKDGMICAYSCKNFADEESNLKLVADTLFKGHKSLPLGEFAIGTNTVAYAVGKKYGITERFPILIAEKTGPHFAIGDTCYCYEEDTMTYNPDGKALIARENECSALRKEAPEKAYFGCHTDITIPYHELGNIYALSKEGEEIYIIKDGRFVLPGLEELNEALDIN